LEQRKFYLFILIVLYSFIKIYAYKFGQTRIIPVVNMCSEYLVRIGWNAVAMSRL